MEQVYFAFGIIAAELGLVAVVTWFVIQLRGETKERDAERRLAVLEKEEEELKKAA
jgi:hypothetical protein